MMSGPRVDLASLDSQAMEATLDAGVDGGDVNG
jgi:hypothetical protein